MGYYGYEDNYAKALILNNGAIAKKASSSYYTYNPITTYGISATTKTYNSTLNSYLRNFRDSCMLDVDSSYYINIESSTKIGYYFLNGSYHTVDVYGLGGIFTFYTDGRPNIPIQLVNSSGSYSTVNTTRENVWDILSFSYSSYYSDRIRVKIGPATSGDGYMWFNMFRNSGTKTLYSTTPITSDPLTYSGLTENKGVYLANYNSQNWICFQGDGELHVTVVGSATGTGYVKVNTSQTNVTSYSQNITVSTWYVDNNLDNYSSGSFPRYYAYVLLHNAYLKSVTQASGTKYIRTLRSTKKNDLKLVVGARSTSVFSTFSSGNSTGASYSYPRKGVAYGNGRFVMVGGGDSAGTGAFYAIGSGSHTYVPLSYSLSCVAYDADDGYFYAATTAGAIYRTQDGSSWALYKSSGPGISGINRIACGNGRIVVQNTSGNSATFNKTNSSWTSVSQPKSCYALCFGAGKFICMSSGSTTSYVYSSTDGTSWTQIGSTTFNSAFYGSVCYGDGQFVACSRDGANINVSIDGATWCRSRAFTTTSYYIQDICYGYRGLMCIYSSTSTTDSSTNYYLRYLYIQSAAKYNSYRWQVKIGNRSVVQISSRTVFDISASELTQDGSYYYVDFDCDSEYAYVKAAVSYNTTETVDDLIDFNSGSMSGKNGVLSATGSTSYSNGYYRANGAPKVSMQHRGKLTLKYGYALENDSGNSTVSAIEKTSLTNSGGYYYYNWNYSTDKVLVNVKFDLEPTLWYPYTLANSLVVDWRNNSVTVPSGLTLSSYSNYNTTYGYHVLNTSKCSPTIYRKYQTTYPYASDITSVIEAKSPLLANITMPEMTNAGVTHLNGVTRLFSPQTRSSTNTYCKMAPYSTDYDQQGSLVSTNATAPYNAVLFKNGYQSVDEIPTHALEDVTAAACTKLKNDWGSNLRIYVVKYRAQDKYASFPYYDKSPTATAHSYTVINNCATNGLVYSADSESALKTRLDEIAEDIKSWTGYEEAKVVE